MAYLFIMPTANTISQYMFMVKNRFATSLKEYGEMVKKELYDNKWKYVYKALTPNQYERTYDFLNANKSIVLKSGSDWQLEVFNDTNMSNSHPSWIDRNSQNDVLQYYILYGNNSSLYSYQARDYWSPTVSYVKKTALLRISQEMRAQGVPCVATRKSKI